MRKTETHILAAAMHALAGEIVSEEGVASAAILEAGARLLEQSVEIKEWREQAAELAVALLSPNSEYTREVLKNYQERIEK
jgi:hypothetical protein